MTGEGVTANTAATQNVSCVLTCARIELFFLFTQAGRQGGSQNVNVGNGDRFRAREIAHEMLHAIGLYHEHQRYDRCHSMLTMK